MISLKQPKFVKTYRYLRKLEKFDPTDLMHEMGRMGVNLLSGTTPTDSGETAQSWGYKIKKSKTGFKLIWTNSVMAGRAPLVLLLQYGHATKSGFFLSGRDFINPALRPVYIAFMKGLSQEVVS